MASAAGSRWFLLYQNGFTSHLAGSIRNATTKARRVESLAFRRKPHYLPRLPRPPVPARQRLLLDLPETAARAGRTARTVAGAEGRGPAVAVPLVYEMEV